mgnify:CR=1 FL=1
MPKLNALEQLDIALKATARDALQGQTSRELAEQFYDSERDLVVPVIRDWMIARLANIIGRQRKRAAREADQQLTLELALGFRGFPKRFKSESGKVIRKEEATINVFRELARRLREKDSPELQDANHAIDLMAKYTPEHPRITWAEVVKREAEKTAKKR